MTQGEIVANSLMNYLERHPEIETLCSRKGDRTFYTTDQAEDFDNHAGIFYGQSVKSKQIEL